MYLNVILIDDAGDDVWSRLCEGRVCLIRLRRCRTAQHIVRLKFPSIDQLRIAGQVASMEPEQRAESADPCCVPPLSAGPVSSAKRRAAAVDVARLAKLASRWRYRVRARQRVALSKLHMFPNHGLMSITTVAPNHSLLSLGDPCREAFDCQTR